MRITVRPNATRSAYMIEVLEGKRVVDFTDWLSDFVAWETSLMLAQKYGATEISWS